MFTAQSRAAATDNDQVLLPLVLADDLTEGLVVIDPESVIRYANPAMTRIFGYGRDELEGEPLTILMPEEYRGRHLESLGEYLATGERHLPWSEVKLPGLHRDGHRLDLRISFSEFTWRGDRLFAGAIRDRTAAKEPEEEQRILARSYRALFEENVAAVFRTSPDGRILAANDALARMAGYEDPEGLRGRDVTAFYAEGENRDEFLRDLREHRKVRNRELRLRRADGATRWCLVNAVWIDDPEDPEPEALVGTVVDISDRKRAERELRLSEERYRRLFEQELVGVFRSEPGPDGEILACNEAIAEMFGYEEPDEMVGLPARRFYPEGREEREQTLEELRQKGSFVRYEMELKRRNGSPIWVLAHSRLLQEPSGRELIEGIFLDITERKAARRVMEQAKEKFETVFEVSEVGIGIADVEGNRIIKVNPAFENLFGYETDEVTQGQVSAPEIWADPDEREALVRDLREETTVRNREVRFQRKDGTVFDGLLSATVATLEGQQYIVGGIQDITEQKRAREALERAKEKFKTVFEVSEVGIGIADLEGDRFIEANPAFENLFGYETDELIENEVSPPEVWADPEEREAVARQLRDGKTVRDREVRFQRKDGSEWDALFSATLATVAGEQYLVGGAQDITEHKAARRAMEQAKEKFETVFEVSEVGIGIADVEGNRIIKVNPAFENLFGYETDEVTQGQVSAPEIWADPDEREALVRDLREETTVRNREVRFQRKDGTVFDGLLSATVATLEGQQYIVGGIQNITEQKRAREALERAKQQFQGVFEISPVALKVVNPRINEIQEVNETFEEVFGYGRHEALEGPLSTEDLWVTAEKWKRIRQQLSEGETVRNEEVRLRREDGTAFDALYSGSVLEREGEPHLVCAVQDISHLKEVERELTHQSLHDRLTELPNRALFWDRLEHALERSRRTGELVAVLFLDLDGFKRINDEHGHGSGDEVLRRVADRLRSAVREADTLARLGGDEFGVLLEDLDEESDAREAARRLTDRFEPTVPVAGEEALLHVSCGIALAGGGRDEAVTADGLVHRADRAMYVAKERPGSSSQLYSPEVAGERTGRLRREIELKEALGAGEVVPHFQPIVDLEDGRVVGAEALARWEHPERGLILPGEFIPPAEETGLIVELGRQVVRAACGQLSRWHKGELLPQDFRLHVNLSAREIEVPDALERLGEMFRKLDVDPERVAFEVTESVAVEAAHVLREIRELGSPVAVDDFGTEYATLERLVEIELDSLKLDRSFVNGIGESSRHEAVLDASLTLAESLGLCPVAEGVETRRQRDGLLERGCRYGQGFLFARAMPAEEFETWLQEGRSFSVE